MCVCVCVCKEEKGRVIYVLPEFTSDYMDNLPGRLERRKERERGREKKGKRKKERERGREKKGKRKKERERGREKKGERREKEEER